MVKVLNSTVKVLKKEKTLANELLFKLQETLINKGEDFLKIKNAVVEFESVRQNIMIKHGKFYDQNVSEEDHRNHRLPFDKKYMQAPALFTKEDYDQKNKLEEERKEALSDRELTLLNITHRHYTKKIEEIDKQIDKLDRKERESEWIEDFKKAYKDVDFEKLQKDYDEAMKSIQSAILEIFKSDNVGLQKLIKLYITTKLTDSDYDLTQSYNKSSFSSPADIFFDKTICDILDEIVDMNLKEISAKNDQVLNEDENETF